MTTAITPTTSSSLIPLPKPSIRIQLCPAPLPLEEVLNNVASIEGKLDLFLWGENKRGGLGLRGLLFQLTLIRNINMRKPDAIINFYSLYGWGLDIPLKKLTATTALTEAVNLLGLAYLKGMYARDFFLFCTQVPRESALYSLITESVLKKSWLRELSEGHKKTGKKVDDFFQESASLFDCLRDLDVSGIYSFMQYVELYFLVRLSILKGLSNGQKIIKIAFVLPNDENKYYLDIPKDIERMLNCDIGPVIAGINIEIIFQYFQYGRGVEDRPYFKNGIIVQAKDLRTYFNSINNPESSSSQGREEESKAMISATQASRSKVCAKELETTVIRDAWKPMIFLDLEEIRIPFLRDKIHNINGWY